MFKLSLSYMYLKTGSGKTFTMEGPDDPFPTVNTEGETVDRRGMISRAVEQVFASAIQMRETGWEVGELVCTRV